MTDTENAADRPEDELDGPGEDLSLAAELWLFMKERKAWWLAPIVVIVVVFAALVVVTESSVMAPFIYALF